MRRLLHLLILIFCFTAPAGAQSLRLTRFAEDEGLPSPLIKSLVRDHNGVLWAASDEGLIRFDGNDFQLYQDQLLSHYAKSVFCLPSGELLLSTDMGVMRFSENNGIIRFDTVALGSVRQSDSAMWFPKLFYSDSKERVWLSDNFRIYRYENRKFRPYRLGPEVATNNYNRSFSFADDGRGNLYAFSETGYGFVYDPRSDAFQKLNTPFRFSEIHAAFCSAPGTILIGTHDGLFEMKTTQPGVIASLRKVDDHEISYIAKNHKGVLFAGTWADGLFELNLQQGKVSSLSRVVQYTEKDVSYIYVDSDDNIWIASDIGILLLQETLFGNQFKQLTTSYIQNIRLNRDGNACFTDGSSVYSALTGRLTEARKLFSAESVILQVIPAQGGFWLSDAAGSVRLVNNDGTLRQRFDFSRYGKAVFRMVRDRNGNLWACQDENKALIRIAPDLSVKFYGAPEGLISRVIALAISGSGELYTGGMTDSAYLEVYNPYIDKFINLSEALNFERNIDINVNDIACVPRSNDIWLGTSFGLVLLHKGEFSRIGLGKITDNSIKAIAIDSLGYVWFANNQGLCRYKDGHLMSFNERNGLMSKTIAYRGLMVDKYNRLWVGTLAGLSVSSTLKAPEKTITPTIRSVLMNNRSAGIRDLSHLSFSNKSFINLKIASPEFPARYLSYERWIEGLDSSWVAIPNDGDIILGGMKPGEYRLKVRALQFGNYIYSDPFILDFKVRRIWYERWWVIVLIVLAFLLLFASTLRRHSRKLRSDNEKLEQIIADRMKEIVKQRDHIEEQNAFILQKNEALSQKNQELELAKTQAEEAAKAKTQFLSVMSHEIRTPMNAVIGITHLLMRDNPRPEQLEDLKILKFSAENLLGLINDVLDLNKIEAGKLVIESIDFNLRNLAEGVYSSMLHKAAGKGIEFRFEYDERLPLFMVSDPLRLAQILNNLVSNAIKFTEHGGVLLEIRQLDRKGDHLKIEFRVSDTGIGIPAEKHAQVFDSFTQASSETSRQYGGTGLGLAITAKLLEMLGSRINLKSEPGEGSEFSFILHLREGQVKRMVPEADQKELNQFRFNGQRVLLVEDNKINELIARKFLEDWNLKVDSAVNGLLAIEKLAQENYHLILMDLQMPEMDGYKTATIIRGRGVEPFLSIPIIALTASPRSEVQDRIRKAGMNDFVSKPYNPDELFLKLSKYLESR